MAREEAQTLLGQKTEEGESENNCRGDGLKKTQGQEFYRQETNFKLSTHFTLKQGSDFHFKLLPAQNKKYNGVFGF